MRIVFCITCLFFNTVSQDIKRAIIVGATSGMGRQVAKLLAHDYEIGLVGRRTKLLQSLQTEIPSKTYISTIDVSQPDTAMQQLNDLISLMGGLDLMVISVSAFNNIMDNPISLHADKKILEIDLRGFWAMAHTAFAYFEKQGSGHLVGISSIDGLRGNASCPVYSAAKSFVSRFLEAKRNYAIQHNLAITVTDIVPGWVDTETITFSAQPGTYWVASTQDAAQQIYNAIKAKKKVAYITKHWQLIAWLLAVMPDWLYNAIGGL